MTLGQIKATLMSRNLSTGGNRDTLNERLWKDDLCKCELVNMYIRTFAYILGNSVIVILNCIRVTNLFV